MSDSTVREILAQITEPNLHTDLISAGVVQNIHSSADGVQIKLAFPYPAATAYSAITAAAQPLLAAAGIGKASFSLQHAIHARTVQGGVERLAGVKNIIAVASAKGGVGKSTTAANLALALAHEGARVGLLDADIYGPSLPVMLGINQKPQSTDDNKFIPITAHGIQTMSIGFMVDGGQPMVWRGPIATRALVQLLRETRWQDIDYLLLDMPPGTGDIQLTIAQQIPVTGALIITTPQALAVSDAARGISMFSKVSIPSLGIIENMSSYHCPHCHHDSPLFGSGGGGALSRDYGVELLGQLPLAPSIGEAADSGTPSVIHAPEDDISQLYRRIAVRAAVKIAEKSRDRSAAFAGITISQ